METTSTRQVLLLFKLQPTGFRIRVPLHWIAGCISFVSLAMDMNFFCHAAQAITGKGDLINPVVIS